MRKNSMKRVISVALAVTMMASMGVGCGKKGNSASNADKVDMENLEFPLAETVTITGTTSYPVGTEEDPNNRTIFKRLEEDTNVHVEWTAISSDQWAD